MKKMILRILNVFKRKNYIPVYKLVDNQTILDGKTALITGGSGGIGFAIAEAFVNAGCNVILAGTNKDKLIKNCNKIGKRVNYIIINMNDIESFENCIEEANKKFGNIDILVNSHGIHTERKNADLFNFTEEEYDNIMNVNLKGTYFFNQAFSNYMISHSIKGHILFISSSTSFEPAWSPYRISKVALNSLVKGLAQKLIKHGIVVNAISPGSAATSLLDFKEGDSIYTNQNTNDRYVMPCEVANFALLLVSNSGDMVVGENICISGGRGRIEIR